MANRLTTNVPKLNRSLQSNNFISQGYTGVSQRDSDYHFNGCEFTANVPVSGFYYPYLNNYQTLVERDFTNTASNAMMASSQFNILKVDYENGDNEVELKVLYSFEDDINKSTARYTTRIAPNEVFYRNYPVENKYFSIELENKSEGVIASGKGRTTLSRYTQYNTPAQSNDVINHNRLVNLERDTNDFLQDVILGRFTDIRKDSRIGIMNEVLSLDQTLWNDQQAFNFTSNTLRNCEIFSSNPIDTETVKVFGLGTADTIVNEVITLAGTTPVVLTLNYKAITDMRANKKNFGKIIIRDADNLETMNVMDARAGRSTSLVYSPNVSDTSGKAIVLDMNINGVAGLINEPQLNIYKVGRDKQVETLLHKDLTYDNVLNKNLTLNALVNGGDIVYGEVSSNALSGSLGHTSYSATINVVEYDN